MWNSFQNSVHALELLTRLGVSDVELQGGSSDCIEGGSSATARQLIMCTH